MKINFNIQDMPIDVRIKLYNSIKQFITENKDTLKEEYGARIQDDENGTYKLYKCKGEYIISMIVSCVDFDSKKPLDDVGMVMRLNTLEDLIK